MRDIKYDGAHLVEKDEEKEETLNVDEMSGYILRVISDKFSLTYEEVTAVLDAETEYLRKKGFIAD